MKLMCYYCINQLLFDLINYECVVFYTIVLIDYWEW